ncbi:hypothetical protein AGLY_008767 [Aphis glycines]|uniref:OTU domain-containing protein n=1 Tax=Aphis glycines TaxID=307491 RepID=A0A6G0TLR8_APHGL|nr:hypothetical protein AGLY_008767 [Aphis glycines]
MFIINSGTCKCYKRIIPCHSYLITILHIGTHFQRLTINHTFLKIQQIIKRKKQMKQMSPILKEKNAQFAQKQTIQKINVFSKINQIQPLNYYLIQHYNIINTITPTTVQLSGPDNKPLCVAGITKIQLQINNNYFDVNTHVIKNLSSTIILRNDFLIKNNALIDFKDNDIILNNNINIQLKINITNVLNFINNTNNIKEIEGSIFDCPDNFSIAHCISSDLKMKKGITNLICKVYDLKASIHNLKLQAIKLNISKIAMPTLDSEPHKFDWSIVKQLLYSEFQNTNIEIHIYYKDKENITPKEHTDIISNINTHCGNNINNNEIETKIINTQCKIINQANNIFPKYKPGENVLSDGNCGLYAVCNALNDNKINKITSILELLELLGLNELPNYWWSDEELAAIAHYYNHDTYIYNDNDNTGIIYGDGNKPPIVLYNVNKNTHWIPGTATPKTSNKIPNHIIHIKQTPTINLQTHNLNIKSTKNDNINTINNIQIIPNDNHTKNNNNNKPEIIPKITDPPQSTDAASQSKKRSYSNTPSYAKMSTHVKSLESIVNKQIKQTDNQISDIITVSDQVNNFTKLYITDYEGTPFSISPNLSIIQHNKVIQLLTEYRHIFTTDTSNIKAANLKPLFILQNEILYYKKYTPPKNYNPILVIPKTLINDILKSYHDSPTAYNATPQTTTKYSPFYLMHGFEPTFPIDNKIILENIPYQLKQSLIELNKIRDKIPQRVHEAQIIQKKYHEKTHTTVNYNINDLVMVKFPFLEVGKSPKLGPI